MWNSQQRTIVYLLKQYNSVPSGLSNTYFITTMNENRKRQKHLTYPTLRVNASGEIKTLIMGVPE